MIYPTRVFKDGQGTKNPNEVVVRFDTNNYVFEDEGDAIKWIKKFFVDPETYDAPDVEQYRSAQGFGIDGLIEVA